MNFLELQNFVLSDRFDETQRNDVKKWLNHRYGRIWAQEAWTFKYTIATISTAINDTSAAATGLQRIHSLWDSSVSPGYTGMDAIRPEDFYGWATRSPQIPAGYTVIGSTVYFDRPMSSARTFTAVGELAFDRLVDDADTPLLPEEFHETLGHGAISEGLRLEQDPTWQAAEEDFKAGIEDMKKAYLTSVRVYADVYPAWP